MNENEISMRWEADDAAPDSGIYYDPDRPCGPALSAYLDHLNAHGMGLTVSEADIELEMPAYDPDMHWTADNTGEPDNGIYYDPDGPCNPSLEAFLDELNAHGMSFNNAVEVLYLTPHGCDIFSFKIGDGPWQTDTNYYVKQDELHQVTVLCCPRKAANAKEQQIQRMNYNTFINTIAEITKKYASKTIEQEEM